MQMDWLSDIYLLPFSPSVLATRNQMDKLVENKASEEKTLLISSQISESCLSLFLLTQQCRFSVHEFKLGISLSDAL